jgi:hypothetical protein
MGRTRLLFEPCHLFLSHSGCRSATADEVVAPKLAAAACLFRKRPIPRCRPAGQIGRAVAGARTSRNSAPKPMSRNVGVLAAIGRRERAGASPLLDMQCRPERPRAPPPGDEAWSESRWNRPVGYRGSTSRNAGAAAWALSRAAPARWVPTRGFMNQRLRRPSLRRIRAPIRSSSPMAADMWGG